jgi:hypothetical protein
MFGQMHHLHSRRDPRCLRSSGITSKICKNAGKRQLWRAVDCPGQSPPGYCPRRRPVTEMGHTRPTAAAATGVRVGSESGHLGPFTNTIPKLSPVSRGLGHRHHQDAVLLAPVRDDVHRGAAVARRPGQEPRHRRGALRLVGLGPGSVGRKSLRPAIEVRHRIESGRCRFVWRMTRLCRERTFFGPSETARSTTRPRPNWTKAR